MKPIVSSAIQLAIHQKSSPYGTILHSFFLLFIIQSCGVQHENAHSDDLSRNGTERIIADNDLTPVEADGQNIPSELRPLLDAFGQLNVGCTATHLGEGLVLTAGHCISRSPRSSTDSCHLLAVVWGNRGGNSQPKISKCKTVVARQYSGGLDYALLKVTDPPNASVKVSREMPQTSQRVTIFSFPRMHPLEWSRDCELREYNDNSMKHLKFFHTCDTEAGSSGAAVIRLDSLQIVGVHNGAADEANYGMFVGAIQELRSTSFILRYNFLLSQFR